jgi:hypothetical protein
MITSMKVASLLILLTLVYPMTVRSGLTELEARGRNRVNPIIGNISYREHHDQISGVTESETLGARYNSSILHHSTRIGHPGLSGIILRDEQPSDEERCRTSRHDSFALFYGIIPFFYLAPSVEEGYDAYYAFIFDSPYVVTFATRHALAPDDALITNHLRYVLQQLRGRDISTLSPVLRHKRSEHLSRLETYIERGVFPRNYDYPGERRPCFIDRDGRICAVGYLIECSAGRPLAEKINNRYQYSELLTMQMSELDTWISESGLSAIELGMIQPSYGSYQEEEPEPDEALRKVELGMISVNVMGSIINGALISMDKRSFTTTSIGIAFGVMGVGLSFANDNSYALADVICGCSAIGLAIWNGFLCGDDNDKNNESHLRAPRPTIGLGMASKPSGIAIPELQVAAIWHF